MLTPRHHSTTRRQFVFGSLVALAAGACVRVAERAAPPPTPTARPELHGWTAQAQAMLSDALETLRTFEVFAAYRVSITPDSGLRFASELTWDPPTGAAWDSATHIARSLHGRADQLFQAVTTAQIEQSVWREQRSLADAIYELRVVGDALVAYRDRIDALPPGDASGALTLLDMAWTQWEGTAARFGISRSEPIACIA